MRFMGGSITPDSSKIMGMLLISVIIGTIIINWVSIMVYGKLNYVISSGIREILIIKEVKKRMAAYDERVEKLQKMEEIRSLYTSTGDDANNSMIIA